MADLFYQLLLPMGLAGSLAFCLLLVLKPLQSRAAARWHKAALGVVTALYLLPLPLFLLLLRAQPALQVADAVHEAPSYAVPITPLYNAGQSIGAGLAAQPTTAAAAPIDWLHLLAIVYFCGVALSLAVVAARYILFSAAVKAHSMPLLRGTAYDRYAKTCDALDINHPPLLCECDNVSTPLLVGVLRPRILLPQGMQGGNTLDYALRHELTHYRHRDIPFKLLCLLAGALHWYNPLAHLLRRDANEACEAHCDETVAAHFDGTQRMAYAMALLNCGEGRRHYMAAGFASPVNKLKKRLGRLVHPVKQRRGMRLWATLLLAAVLMAGALAGCSLAAGAMEEPFAPTDTKEPEPPVQSSSLPEPQASVPAPPQSTPPVDETTSMVVPDENAEIPEALLQMAEGAEVNALPEGTPAQVVALVKDKNENYLTGKDIQHQLNWLETYRPEVDPWADTRLQNLGALEPVEIVHNLQAIVEEQLDGGFINPVPEYSYCYRGFSGGHKALDFNANFGAEIIAAAGGEVITAEYHWSYGWHIVIDHGDNMRSLYAHCQELYVEEGDMVEQGQAIAEVGASGTSTGPHLHFEIIEDGERTDPMQYIFI